MSYQSKLQFLQPLLGVFAYSESALGFLVFILILSKVHLPGEGLSSECSK